MKYYENQHEQNVSHYFSSNGEVLRRTYDLTPDSIIFDVGSYDSKWGYEMYQKYNCNIVSFEPVSSFYLEAKEKYKDYTKITFKNYGLGGSTRKEDIIISKDGSSLFIQGNEREEIEIVSMKDELNLWDNQIIDLCKINIEGMEYELMEHIISENLQTRFKNFQIQFHPFGDYEKQSEHIQSELLKTHYLTYQFPYVWENWQIA